MVLKRETEIASDQSISSHTARKLDRVTIAMLVVVAGIVVLDRLIPEESDTAAGPVTEIEQAVVTGDDDRQSVGRPAIR